MNEVEEQLNGLFEIGKYEEAIKFADEHNISINVNNDYGLRNAIHKGKWEFIPMLIKRGAKLSTNNYEGLWVYLESYGDKNLEKVKYLFSLINREDRNAPTFQDILIRTKNMNKDMLKVLYELGYIESEKLIIYTDIQKLVAYAPTNTFISLLHLLLEIKQPLPEPVNKIRELYHQDVKIFEYYYKNYKDDVLKEMKQCNSFNNEVIKYIIWYGDIDPQIYLDILDKNRVFTYLINSYEDSFSIEDIEQFIENNKRDLIKIEDTSFYMNCGFDDDSSEIEEYQLERLKLLVKYNLVDIRSKNDKLYHYAHFTNSKETIEYLDQFYTLTFNK